MIGQSVPKPVRVIDEPLRAWIRQQPCLLWGAEKPKCGGYLNPATRRYVSEACHVRSRGAGGHDPENLWPGCAYHHQLQHLIGTKEFEKRELGGRSLKRIAKEYDAQFRREVG